MEACDLLSRGAAAAAAKDLTSSCEEEQRQLQKILATSERKLHYRRRWQGVRGGQCDAFGEHIYVFHMAASSRALVTYPRLRLYVRAANPPQQYLRHTERERERERERETEDIRRYV